MVLKLQHHAPESPRKFVQTPMCCISNAFPGDAGIVAALGELFTDFLQNRSIPLWVYFHILEHLKFSRYVYGVSQMRYNLGEECVCS